MEVGSIADWFSGAGSFAAVGVALYLAGSERRARKLAERPAMKVVTSSNRQEGLVGISISLKNYSTVSWEIQSIQVLKPSTARLVKAIQEPAYDDGGSIIPWETGTETTELVRMLPMNIVLEAGGSPTLASQAHQPGDRAYFHCTLRMGGAAKKLVLHLQVESLEAVPTKYMQRLYPKI